MANHTAADKNTQTTHYLWVDFMRVTATFLVVLAHIGTWGSGPYWAEAFYYSISRTGVPLFFMLSGFLLLPHQEDTWIFLRKRAWKILIPFIIWSVIYDVYVNQALANTGLTFEAIIRMVVRILRGPRAPHLWYLYALIGLYLFTPILRLFIARASRVDVAYYIAIWLLAVPVFLLIQGFTPIRSGFELYYFSGYIGYFLLGFLLAGLHMNKAGRIGALMGFLVGLTITFVVVNFNLFPQLDEAVLRTYFSLNVVVMCVSGFLLLKSMGEWISPTSSNLLQVVSRSSFGIYLMHWLIVGWLIQLWNALGFSQTAGPSLFIMSLAALIVFLISFGITHVLRMIPFVKTVVP